MTSCIFRSVYTLIYICSHWIFDNGAKLACYKPSLAKDRSTVSSKSKRANKNKFDFNLRHLEHNTDRRNEQQMLLPMIGESQLTDSLALAESGGKPVVPSVQVKIDLFCLLHFPLVRPMKYPGIIFSSLSFYLWQTETLLSSSWVITADGGGGGDDDEVDVFVIVFRVWLGILRQSVRGRGEVISSADSHSLTHSHHISSSFPENIFSLPLHT